MSELQREINSLHIELARYQNQITRLSILGFDVGHPDVDAAVSAAKSTRKMLNYLKRKNRA